MARASVIFGGIAVLTFAGFVQVGVRMNRQTHDALSTAEKLRTEVAGLEQSLSQSQQRMREPRSIESQNFPTNVVAPSKEEDAPKVAPPPKKRELTKEEQQYREQVLYEAQTSLFQKTYQEERLDPRWARPAAEAIRGVLSDKEFDELNVATDCRSTLCRTEISFSTPTIADAAVQKLMKSQPWPGPQQVVLDRKQKTIVSYLAREGSSLPTLDPEAVQY